MYRKEVFYRLQFDNIPKNVQESNFAVRTLVKGVAAMWQIGVHLTYENN